MLGHIESMEQKIELQNRHRFFEAALVSLLAVLPAFTTFKLGSLQTEDFLLLFLLGFCLARFLCSGFSFKMFNKLHGLLKSYGLLLLLLFLMAVLALRLPFYAISGDVSLLKKPVIFSISKLLQMSAIICGFFWLTNIFMRNEYYLDKALNLYWYVGIVSSWYSLASCLLLKLVHTSDSGLFTFIGAYGISSVPRARGFFNEGGPYGVYIVSIFVVGFLRRYRMRRALGLINILVLSASFLLSASKAGFFVAGFLVFYAVLTTQSVRKRVIYLVLSTAILSGAAVWWNIGDLLLGYMYSYQNMEELLATRGADLNLVLGRVAAAYIVPRMIEYHPVTGIGLGNYPLMRNDPHYLGSLPSIRDEEDLPALGVPGIAAEMGIPATIWLLLLLFAPYWTSRKTTAVIATGALFHPLAIAFGVQLTFAYPWFVSACVLATSYRETTKAVRKELVVPGSLIHS